ncbi:MAG: type IV toxin-antitoxin system AbiEi family antitoxin [Candidatus Saccharicenans sp.]|nr:type IV toxin-antitoxin system AbiEi family antitoxin [Candidatus Saccharicenans sp.]
MSRDIEKYKNINKSLGPISTFLIQQLSKKGMTVFTTRDAISLVDINPRNLNKIIHDLVIKGWLRRIEKGKYMLFPLGVDSREPYSENHYLIASKLINPYYIGFWSALHFYGYTEQLLNTIFVVSTKRKKEISLSGVNYKFIRLKPTKFFGISEVKIEGGVVTFSDREKTFTDCLAYPEYCGGIQEIVKGLWKAKEELDLIKLIDYANRMQNSTIIKRLGFLLECLDLRKGIDFGHLMTLVKSGYSILDPLLPEKGTHDSRWNLLINVSKEDLFSFKRT